MIVGETVPSNLGSCQYYIHPNLRIAYVAQHAFYHVEQHINDSPVSYIQWRFKDGFDKEKMESAAYKISEEEQKAISDFGLERIMSRRMRAGKVCFILVPSKILLSLVLENDAILMSVSSLAYLEKIHGLFSCEYLIVQRDLSFICSLNTR